MKVSMAMGHDGDHRDLCGTRAGLLSPPKKRPPPTPNREAADGGKQTRRRTISQEAIDKGRRTVKQHPWVSFSTRMLPPWA